MRPNASLTARPRGLQPLALPLCAALAAAAGICSPSPKRPVPHPVVVGTGAASDTFLLGGTLGGKWVGAERMAPLLAGAERYRLYTLARYLGSAAGTKPTPQAPGEYQSVALSPMPRHEGDVVGVAGSWNALPRAPRVGSTGQATYRDAARAVLKEHGLPKAPVRLTQVLRVDLEGDGAEEVLVAATTPNPEYGVRPGARANDYSFVFLRKLVQGKVRTFPLGWEFYRAASQSSAPQVYHVAAVLDLNGDGILEILVAGRYYEGAGATAYQMQHGRPIRVLSDGYGA